ncbi:porin [Cupriavidus agavae]|nr:porin [Cupriavidus agavae]
MKMKLFAAAVAALAAGGAYAQSSVTLYGVVDAGIEYQNHQPNAAGQTGSHDVTRLSSGNMSGSRWGLRGVEDLGGGLKGVFVLESGFNVDAGTQGQNRLFGRQAFVGVQSNYGTLTLGRHQTPLYDFGLAFDPMAIATNYSITSQDAGFASRADNSLKYIGKFGGLTGTLLYSQGTNTGGTANTVGGVGYQGTAGEVPGNYKLGRAYSASLIYAAGPFSVGAVYDETNLGINTAAQSDAKIRRASVAGTYAFGPAKVFAGYRWAKGVDGAVLPGAVAIGQANNATGSNLYWLGAGYQLTPAFSLTGAAYYQDFRNSGADPWSFVASADYAFSKRTDAYLNVAYTKNKDGSTLGLSGTGAGGSGFGSTLGSYNQFGAVVGVRHKF